MKTIKSVLIALLALLFVAASALPAQQTLTENGELARLSDSTEGLQLAVGDQTFAVPSLNSSRAAAVQLVRAKSGHLIAIWRSGDPGQETLETASFDGEYWTETVVLSAGSEPFYFSSPPIVLTTTDRVEIEVNEDETAWVERQLAHVVWEEDGRIRYSALIFQNGVNVGWNEIVTVSSAFREAHQANGDSVSLQGDATLLNVKVTSDNGIQLTLADQASASLATLRIEAVPLLIEMLGDSVFQQILDLADLYDPEAPSAIADEIGGHIVYTGSRLNLDPSVSDFLSAQIARWLEGSSSDFGWDLLALADASRSNTLDLGRSVYSVSVPGGSVGGEVPVLDIGDFLDDNGHRDEFARLVRIRIDSDYPEPEIVGEDSIVHVSEDGSAVAMSWTDAEGVEVHWIENHGSGWSTTKSLAINETLNELAIRQLIESSIR